MSSDALQATQFWIMDFGEAARSSPYSPLGILRQALASGNVRRGDNAAHSVA
ncbi:hypothetical protein [Nostoc sp.]|uniref:hypothetical protein n=1 Tax=Nostoc sp. TaxID=1180 RepID=UPI002FFD1DEF